MSSGMAVRSRRSPPTRSQMPAMASCANGGGSLSGASGNRRRMRARAADASPSGSWTAVSASALQATAQAPIAVENVLYPRVFVIADFQRGGRRMLWGAANRETVEFLSAPYRDSDGDHLLARHRRRRRPRRRG